MCTPAEALKTAGSLPTAVSCGQVFREYHVCLGTPGKDSEPHWPHQYSKNGDSITLTGNCFEYTFFYAWDLLRKF